ncbi:hypothetical protein LGM38_14730 [Burkholderia vietnamiensis]|uniref:hypothetical protein n=1 Tax=Burkholderia vietnamiensis TaxID=60552 RepID=UPI001CF172ED|nr:hypothetical protein [Burkholderia vietnamiensis]MCA8013304.1 hypothetical protein [Burkholderia vietnamiensis]
MPDITLSLGDVQFADTEIPEVIKVKTGQRSVVHKFVGGARQVDLLGADHEPIEWSGLLIGQNALDRALTLKGMTDAALPIFLAWSEFFYLVVVTGFDADYERDYQIPYQITCTVVQDMTTSPGQGASDSLDDLINGDMSTATSLASSIGDSGVSGAISTLGSAVSAVSNFAKAAKSTINSVLTPLNQARTVVGTLIAATENTIQSVTTLGGILPGNPVAANVSRLFSQINAFQSQQYLVQLDSVLGRMGKNIGRINSGVRTIQSGGGSLFDIASKFYKDVSGWTALSRANPQLGGDPKIVGNQSIAIPPYKGGSGGILGA